MAVILLADSGATKTEWCVLEVSKKKHYFTQGISPYFLDTEQITALIQTELMPQLKTMPSEVYYYGTGCANATNVRSITRALKNVFPKASSEVETDLTAAARALFGNEKGIACILGTGSNSGFYNGKKITKNSPGLGYVLGDEASGAYLGKKVVQYFLYKTFDEELTERFNRKFNVDAAGILDQVYKKPLANRYLAKFTMFLAENRGHYMIENILEDGLNDFFFQHLCKFAEVWKHPVSFVGSVAFGFKDVIEDLCRSYEFELGKILKNPMEGLANFHNQNKGGRAT